MRHKMRLVWMLMTLMTVGVTLTDGTLESWGFSQLLSLLGHGDHGLESEARSLSRHRRDVSTGSEYILDVEISIPDPSLAIQIKQYLTNNLSYPLPLGSGDTNITSIKVTTACNQTGSEVQCSCESGYTWATDVCTAYTQCPGYSNCSCIKSNTFPSQFCQPQTVNTKLSLTMQKAFTSDLYDPTSSTFKEYKGALENQFNKSYQSLPGFKSATVTGFRPGSVIADYTVVSEATTPEALSTANSALISDLANTTYAATSVNSIVTGWSTLTVDPATSYLNDSVTLSCTVNVTSYSAVSWYFNGTQKIANDSNWSFATGSVTGGIQSYLTIKKASFIYSGTYQCNIDLNSNTYTASTTLQVQSMELSPMTSVVTCDGTKVPIIQCCTKEGTVTFNLTCQKTSGNIIGITESSALCQAYNIMADSQSCSSAQSSSFGCTCTTNKGAILQQDVTVAYQTSYQVNVTASSDQISEWTDLTLTCKCNVPSVQSITWNFINNNNVSSAITNTYSSSNLNTCTSTLTIPAASTSVNWNGTFSCVVNAAYTGNKGIVIYRLAKSSEITISPITKGFVLGTPIDFSCCLDTATAYRPDKTVLEISCNPGSNIPSQPMTLSGSCFTTSYTIPSVTNCASFVAACNITNLIGSTVKSNQMVLNVIQNPQCTGSPPDINLNIGVGEAGKNYTVSCSQIDPNLEGNRIYNCDGATKQWVKVSDNCVSKVLNNINNQATILGSSPNPNVLVPNVVSQLNETVSQNKNITASVANIELVVNILQQVGSAATSVQPNVMQDFLNTVSIVVDSSTTSTWNQTQNKVNQSSNLLESVEKFAKSLIITDSSVSIIKPNVQLKGEIASNLTTSYNAMFDFSQSNKLTGNVTINKNILDQMPKDTRVVSIAYATLKDIIGVPSNTSTNKTVNGLVMTTVLSNKSTISIAMDFKISDTNLTNASCVWWNPITQDWDGTGCYLGTQSTNDTINCVCNHLTSFSILMSTSDLSPEAKIILSYITYIGVGISMLSLVVCIIIETMVWKSVTKNKTSYLRHVCIMNIAVTLLMADIWFIVGAALNPTDNTQACVAATFFAHLFYLCVFFWMLTMGLILFYRLMCVFHDLSKTTMMGISFFLGYGCPIIITVVTVAATQSRNIYLMPTDCWLNMVESKAFLAFVIPAFTILLVNFITLLVVIVKVLRPSVGDKPKKEEKSTLNHITKCILILTPLLGLTWGFGIGTMVTDTVAIHGIFAALNSLQGFFILLFGCLMDKKVRDALFSRFTISRWSSQQTKTSNLSSSDPVFAKKGINLFGKKGVYNINSAQANSSSDMASSNSYSLLT